MNIRRPFFVCLCFLAISLSAGAVMPPAYEAQAALERIESANHQRTAATDVAVLRVKRFQFDKQPAFGCPSNWRWTLDFEVVSVLRGNLKLGSVFQVQHVWQLYQCPGPVREPIPSLSVDSETMAFLNCQSKSKCSLAAGHMSFLSSEEFSHKWHQRKKDVQDQFREHSHEKDGTTKKDLEQRQATVVADFDWAVPTSATSGNTFKDCSDCPEMVPIPAGVFDMGSNDGDTDEKPVHRVNVSQFAIGKFEVTRGQFSTFISTSGYDAGNRCWVWTGGQWDEKPDRNWRSPGFNQSDSEPVACVNLNDAQAYAKWLSQKTGHLYRLPSEAEWEYACRAGDNPTYCGSNDLARVAVYKDNSGYKTQAVGTKAGNAWGLHDMTGNVWEWTQDCWNENYDGAPSNSGARTDGDCGQRVLRGGAWSLEAVGVRATLRNRYSLVNRFDSGGFRLVRTAPR